MHNHLKENLEDGGSQRNTIQSHQTGNKKTENLTSKRCLFLSNQERNKKLSQMPILIASKVKQFINTPNDGDITCLLVY